MTASLQRADFEHRVALIDDLVQRLESAPDPVLRSTAQDLVQTLMELHGTGLERIVAVLQESGQAGKALLDDMLADDVIRCVLLLHGLHPVDIVTRVEAALEKTRPYLKTHSGNVQLLGVEDGEVRLRLQGTCHGCPSSSVTLKLAIEKAIHEAAPDVTSIVVDDSALETQALVQIGVPNGKANGNGKADPWADLGPCPAALPGAVS